MLHLGSLIMSKVRGKRVFFFLSASMMGFTDMSEGDDENEQRGRQITPQDRIIKPMSCGTSILAL